MGWVSPKVYAILKNSEEGKNILEGIADKDQAQVDKEVDEFFANGKGKKQEQDDGIDEITTSEEQEFIKQKTKAVWQGSPAGPRIEFLHEELNKIINDLPDVYSDMIISTMKQELTGGIWQGKGQGYYSPSEKKIVVDRYMLLNNADYERNSVFFHEVGHAVDRYLGNGMKVSSRYISNKYNKSLAQMVFEEASQITDEDFEEIVKASEDTKDDVEKQLTKLRAEYDVINEKQLSLYKKFCSMTKDEFIGKFGEEAVGLSEYQYNSLLFTKAMSSELGISSLKDFYQLSMEEQNAFRTKVNPEITKKVKEFKAFKKDKFDKNPNLAPVWEEYQKAYDELNEKRLQIDRIHYKNNRVWGNAADLIGGAHKKQGADGVVFGHRPKYWENYQIANLGSEAFAEFFEGITNHKEAYFNMKQVFPKSADIFEEIMQNGKLSK